MDGEKTEYRLNGSTILSETTGSETLFYYYDAGGALVEIGWQKDGEEQKYYAVVRNGQGDVTGLCDAATMTPIGSYTYDAWGKPLSVAAAEGAEAYDPGGVLHKQPFRYRGYYYDPQVRRFLNVDTILAKADDSLGYNLFAYCLNDPVNQTDPSGTMTDMEMFLASVAIIAALVAAAALLVAAGPAAAAAACIVKGAAVGAATGAVQGAASGAVTGAVMQVVTTGSFEGAGEAAIHGAASGMFSGTITGAITGAITSPFCFVAGTLVLTAEGLVPIEAVCAGDIVWAEEPESGEQSLSSVVQTFGNETEALVHVTVEGDTITSTPHHPFYSPVKGWTDALDLRAGDVIVRSNGEYVIVEQVQHEILENPVKVYNFEVQDYHTYYVGCREVLVHNMCTGNGLKNFYKSIKDAPKYPKDFEKVQNGMKKVKVNNGPLLDGLRKIKPGDWSKVYQNGYSAGQEVSVHYFQHVKTGMVFDVKVISRWSKW